MTESEFDALLRRALIDVIHEDCADILEGEPDVPPHTEKYLRRERKLLADPLGYVRRLARPVWKKALRMAACILLALATLFGSVMALSPSARAWVVQMYIEWREDHVNFIFTTSSEAPDSLAEWRPRYIPKGYGESSVIPIGGVVKIVYEDDLGNSIDFKYRLLKNGGGFSADTEHGELQEIEIGDFTGTLLLSNVEGYSSRIFWINEDEETAFMIIGTISSDDIKEMAESVEKIN